MRKSKIIRKIWDDAIVNEEILGYVYNYNGVDFGIYNCKDYNCQFHTGFIPVLISKNDNCNGLSLLPSKEHYLTLKQTLEETKKTIDKNIDLILRKIQEC